MPISRFHWEIAHRLPSASSQGRPSKSYYLKHWSKAASSSVAPTPPAPYAAADPLLDAASMDAAGANAAASAILMQSDIGASLDEAWFAWFPGYGVLVMFFALSGFLIAASAFLLRDHDRADGAPPPAAADAGFGQRRLIRGKLASRCRSAALRLIIFPPGRKSCTTLRKLFGTAFSRLGTGAVDCR
jgi:hypothetical protein